MYTLRRQNVSGLRSAASNDEEGTARFPFFMNSLSDKIQWSNHLRGSLIENELIMLINTHRLHWPLIIHCLQYVQI